MDRLSTLFNHFEIKTKVFSYGTLCGEHTFELLPGHGHIHVIKKAPLEILLDQEKSLPVSEPSLIFFSKPTCHSFKSLSLEGADMICATVNIGSGINNPLIMGFPEVLIIPLSKLQNFEKIFDLLYQEVFENRCGKQQAVDLLMEYLVVRMYRFAIQENLVASSAIAGLADPKITKAVEAIHQKPGYNWNLEKLASEARMSKSSFAEHFKHKVGIAPIHYLTELRINLAMRRLQQGKSVKSIYSELGYSSVSSFTRAFQQKSGLSPKVWLEKNLPIL
jgi:AraC-like DNA-binding protein